MEKKVYKFLKLKKKGVNPIFNILILAPKLKGRPRKRAKVTRAGSPGSESGSSESSAATSVSTSISSSAKVRQNSLFPHAVLNIPQCSAEFPPQWREKGLVIDLESEEHKR